MLSKKCNENDVRMMFAPFGTIDDCTVLREQNGQSKGSRIFIMYSCLYHPENGRDTDNVIKWTLLCTRVCITLKTDVIQTT